MEDEFVLPSAVGTLNAIRDQPYGCISPDCIS